MIPADPLLDLERKNVTLVMVDGERIRGRLLSVRGDLLTIQSDYPRRRRITISRYAMRSIEEEGPKISSSPSARRLSKVFWR